MILSALYYTSHTYSSTVLLYSSTHSHNPPPYREIDTVVTGPLWSSSSSKWVDQASYELSGIVKYCARAQMSSSVRSLISSRLLKRRRSSLLVHGAMHRRTGRAANDEDEDEDEEEEEDDADPSFVFLWSLSCSSPPPSPVQPFLRRAMVSLLAALVARGVS